jgi:hypothetical protein
MTHSFKLSRRMARYRAPLLAALMLIGACNSTDSLDQGPTGDSPVDDEQSGVQVAPVDQPSLSAVTFAGGIPIGTSGQPNGAYGSTYNGAYRIIWPEYLLSNLKEIKARGGKVVLDMAGAQRLWRDASGHFSMTKWKARIARYKNVNFSSYVTDGTIVGHFLMDEPNDPTNWSGTTVSPATVEAMAQYSKQLWPNLPTIIRAEPAYMNKWSGTFRYLDAAWAQYVTWKGTPSTYLTKNVAEAQKAGLALVVGLNITKGGYNGGPMTASQIKTWGSAMLASSYPCAFISWKYTSYLLSSSALKDAMNVLRNKAENRSTKSCRG